MNNYYTAAVTIEKLSIPRSTFYHLIHTGELPEGVFLPLRRQALYPKEEIDRLVEARARYLEEVRYQPERLRFMVPAYEDVLELVEIGRAVFGAASPFSTDDLMKRLAYNPEYVHVLKDIATNTTLGGVTLSPLVHNELMTLLDHERRLAPENYRSFRADAPQNCFVGAIVVLPGALQVYHAAQLLRFTARYLVELSERGVVLSEFYTVATTDAGAHLAERLGFVLLAVRDERRLYALTLKRNEAPSRLVRAYMQHARNRKRRMKRYQKQHEGEHHV